MIVLGIETTCDETAAAIVEDGQTIHSNVVASQIPLHQAFGGVYPELASRSHLPTIIPVIEKALADAHMTKSDIDLISVAYGPGLIGSLLIGLNTAKALSIALDRPYMGVNHVEAHLYAAMMQGSPALFPSLGVVISGGHTFLVHMNALGNYHMIGTTVDDAIGEAFDKVGALLGLPYPGGPAIESLALEGNPSRYNFKRGKVKERPWDFSFSGLKTNVFYTIKGQDGKNENVEPLSRQEKADIAASFQETALGDVVDKCIKASLEFECQAIYLGGGVSNNKRLRYLLEEKTSLDVFWPPFGLSLDNAAMIAGLGYHKFLQNGKGDLLDLEPMTRIPFTK